MIRKNNYYISPEHLLKELGITQPEEIDIEAIAFYVGATVIYRKLDGCAARIVGKEDKAVISVHSGVNKGRQRFSIGHEIGHWMRDRGKTVVSCQQQDFRRPWGYEYRKDPESMANEYASNLLLPEFMFTPAARGRPMTFDTVEKLSEKFITSRTATAIKLVQYGSFPAILVCHSKNARKWYTKGSDIPDYLHPHRELSPDTNAFALLYGAEERFSRPLIVDTYTWINYPSSEGYKIHEHSIKVAEDEVITLLWWKDEKQLVELRKRRDGLY